MNPRRLTLLALCAAAVLGGAGCNKAQDAASGPRAADARPTDGRKPRLGRFTIPELQAKMDDAKAGKLQLFVYDNNEKERFLQSHLPGARWLEFDEIKETDLPKDKEATLVFYCANDH